MRIECDRRMTIMAIQKYQTNNRACITCIRDPRILIVSNIKAAQKKYLLSGLNDLKPRSLRCQRMVCTSTFEKNHSPILPVNLIVRKMTSPTFSGLQQSMIPPSLLCICIFANTLSFLFAPTKAVPSVGEGSHCPSRPSPSLP